MSVMGPFNYDISMAFHCQSLIDTGALPSETLRLIAKLPRKLCLGRRIWDPRILYLGRCDELVDKKLVSIIDNRPYTDKSMVTNKRYHGIS
ncbi:hypothetical protein CARUB_v10028540mg [Capsella rubella]|uniref:Uncharacterized protein n=1 Tax=Capsella rubella TaxID=81985 RepID=R0GVH1_9BRAS|nr:hypothetical protein CARUB_v10028540mg [Capsella rubella]